MSKSNWLERLFRPDQPVAKGANFGLLSWLGGKICQDAKLKQLVLQTELVKAETALLNSMGDNMKARLRLHLLCDPSFQESLAKKLAAEEVGVDLLEELLKPEDSDEAV